MCSVPGCPSLQNTIAEEKSPTTATFPAPKDPKLLELWREKIPVTCTRRVFGLKNRVCNLHFEEDLMEFYFVHNINGQQIKLERTRPRLKPEAVPTKLLTNTMSSTIGTKAERKVQHKVKKRKIETEGLPCTPTESGKNIGLHSNVDTCRPMLSDHNETSCILDERADLDVSVLSYSYIRDHCDSIHKPSTQWGTHIDANEEYVAFSCVRMSSSEGPHMEKMLVFKDKSEPKLYLHGRPESVLPTEYARFHTLENIAEFLQIIHDKVVCQGTLDVPKFSPDCAVFVLDQQCEGNYQCSHCAELKHHLSTVTKRQSTKPIRKTPATSVLEQRVEKLNETIARYKQEFRKYGFVLPRKPALPFHFVKMEELPENNGREEDGFQ